jgi:signal transduction histidine kinase
MDMSNEEVEMAAVTKACLNMVRERAGRAGVRLDSNIPADLPVVRGDSLRVKQVLLNLIGNAVKFTPREGSVSVIAGLRDGGVFVTVLDTGIGISSGDLEHVTEPFAQASNSMTRGYEGTGLGLSLVKSLMALHGGGLAIASEPGRGTEATIHFPEHRTMSGAGSPL